MNVSPAQLELAQSLAATSSGTATSASVAEMSQQPGASESISTSPPPTPSPFELSTNLQVDNQHQEYYEFVDKDTGAVVFEIPPEALRAIAESLNIPLEGQSDYHNLDVSS